ncbi:unnamed protein product [Rotaria sp. Silwood2]|nr:unnamed protein product [Rotaria sp. Silwood2]CAF3158257.1 unnamed protein product [Rotaria sp. Silwood2]CAF3913752.1 unnamed protein product [Rotaria sp. Silwood2]CAF3977603.1 unnamed protein product [Rotaria sp. Silwood2]
MVNSATTKTTNRRVAVTNARNTKAPLQQSAYTYLRFVRGTQSCSSGMCPFWQRHGRSFVSLRCYAQQYRECTCLHRMCFSSCMFERKVCNDEMVSCLRQICRRCMPVSAQAMCSVYDSVAEEVTKALAVFACYPCCPVITNMTNQFTNGPNVITVTTAPLTNSIGTTTVPIGTNGPVSSTNGFSQNTVTISSNGNKIYQSLLRATKKNLNFLLGPNQSNTGGSSNTNVQGNTTPFPGVFPGSGPLNSNNNNGINQVPRAPPVVRQTRKPVVTSRRTPTPTRRTSTVRGSNIKNGVRTTVRVQKPQTTSNRIKN